MVNLLLLVPILLMVTFMGLVFMRKSRDSKKWDIPFRDDHERAPGESLRLKLEEMEEQLLENVLYLCFAAAIPFILLGFNVPAVSAIAVVIMMVGIQLHHCRKIWKLIPEIRCRRIGFDGERLTAQYLQPLLCQGHFVFHDIPMKGYNVDHVVVGPNGVFAIETKTRRKPRSAGSERARVKYDGKTLQYPEQRPETWGLEAASSRARDFQRWLNSAVGESITVHPILALPGWYIERTGKGALPVMSPKSIPNFITKSNNSSLSETQIKRIKHQLFEKSKVEATS